MDETLHPLARTWKLNRKKADQIVIGLVLAVIVCVAIVEYVEYFREVRIATEIQSLGGVVKFQRCGPDWMPELWPCDRIVSVCMVMTNVTTKTASDLGSLKQLQYMSLTSTEVTDADLEHLKGLTMLKELYLNYTKTTEEGRTSLRTAIQQCKIYPDP